jgi:hypothetical protein
MSENPQQKWLLTVVPSLTDDTIIFIKSSQPLKGLPLAQLGLAAFQVAWMTTMLRVV